MGFKQVLGFFEVVSETRGEERKLREERSGEGGAQLTRMKYRLEDNRKSMKNRNKQIQKCLGVDGDTRHTRTQATGERS